MESEVDPRWVRRVSRRGLGWLTSGLGRRFHPAFGGGFPPRLQRWPSGKVSSFEEIAGKEGKVERHIRNLACLAFVSPRLAEAIANGTASADLTVTMLAHPLPHSWAEPERKFGIS